VVSAHVRADRDVCIGAGNCVMTLGSVFDQDDDGVVVVLQPQPDGVDPELLQRAVVMCPAGAITVTTT
jgi:ferredoxin